MERDDAWKRVFERLPVLETLERDGLFYVTAEELKIHGGREPRLMAKIDTLSERPAILAENGLALFPVKNGRYVLFPDPTQKCFFRFPEEETPPLRPFQSKIDLAQFDTFPNGQEFSESQALDFAYISTLLPTFCGEMGMRLTLRGRLFSGSFRFQTPNKGSEVEVNRVQIEIDAGYEGAEGLYLIEAKRGRREDFHIRQLWYPWLHWRSLTRKRIMPIFFAYSNGQFFLTEFEFGETYGDIRILRNRAYCLDESPLTELDLRGMSEEIEPGLEPEGTFPQANDVDKIVDIVQSASSVKTTKAQIASLFDMEERQGDYYGNAACYLGLLKRSEDGFEITPEGLEFTLMKSRADRTHRLIFRMFQIPSLRECLSLLVSRDYRAEKIQTQELAEIVQRWTSLGATTPWRRASTVRAWLGWIMRNIKIRKS